MELKKVLLIGGSGFVGDWIANRLSERGIRVIIPTRHRDHHKKSTLVPTVFAVEADIHQPEQLAGLMEGVDAVINLVGILHDNSSDQPYGKRFAKAHVELPKKIVAAMKQKGIRRLLHMSALKAAADAPSGYLRSKAAGEAVVLAAADELDVTVFRPSVIFGPGDRFLTTFAKLLGILPIFPLAGASARFQPVYVGDVADALVSSLKTPDAFGRTYELCGPTTYSLRELVDYAGQLIGKHRLIIELPGPMASMQASLLGLLPKPPMSRDNLRSMQIDSVFDGQRNFPGWNPHRLEAIAPGYLAPIRPKRRLDGYRCRAGR